jgi:hypothetical protein
VPIFNRDDGHGLAPFAHPTELQNRMGWIFEKFFKRFAQEREELRSVKNQVKKCKEEVLG